MSPCLIVFLIVEAKIILSSELKGLMAKLSFFSNLRSIQSVFKQVYLIPSAEAAHLQWILLKEHHITLNYIDVYIKRKVRKFMFDILVLCLVILYYIVKQEKVIFQYTHFIMRIIQAKGLIVLPLKYVFITSNSHVKISIL